MTAFAGGLISLILGIILIIVWWGYFIKALAAGVPVVLILGGALATYLGIEEMRDRKVSESFDTGPSDLKDEVGSLKQEIKDLKQEKDSAQKEEKVTKAETKTPEKEEKVTKAETKTPEKEEKK